MAKPRITVIHESVSGRNEQFRDNQTGKLMSRDEFVRAIDKGKYPDYHIREINGVPTPVSNPDKLEQNNLD